MQKTFREILQDIFASARQIRYNLRLQFADFDAFLKVILSNDKAGINIEDMDINFVKELFEQARHKNIFEFEQVRSVDLYRNGNATPATAS